jgi:hypothetical protein
MNVSARKESRFFARHEDDDLSSNRHRQAIGYSGLVLPILLWLIAAWRPTAELPAWKLLSSVSAYYYTGAVSVFAGLLVALALFLFSYWGYANKYQWRDRLAAIIAAIAAVLVAFFPTGAPDNIKALSWWTPLMGRIHCGAAVALFLSFIFFSLCLFRQSKPGESLSRGKRFRNYIHIFCGAAMIACMVWAGVAYLTDNPIFWPEALALEFFAVSWLVKGRADVTVVEAGRWGLHYGRHPRQFFAGLRKHPAA